LSLDEDEQMKSLEQKWRYNLRQALTNDFEIRLHETDADIATFQALYATMVARKNFHHAGMVNVTPELTQLPEPIRLRIVLAFHHGRPICGATVGLLGDTAYYLLGATDDAALSLKTGYTLQWWIIRWLSKQNVRWYDLGGEAGEHGLRQFKKGLTGKRGSIVVMNGEYDRWTRLPGRLATDLIYSLRGLQRTIRHWRHGL
jgi:lipid II:glycine glycyltransferase (peptidoglycan interpeptide bridge formation enzyme)